MVINYCVYAISWVNEPELQLKINLYLIMVTEQSFR